MTETEILLPTSLADVNEQLDSLLVQQLELTQDYVNLSLENEKQLKDGFFHIARARYNMGQHSLSKICFPTEDVDQIFLADVTIVTDAKNIETTTTPKRILQISKPLKFDRDEDDATIVDSSKSMASQFGVLKSPSLKAADKSFHSSLNQVIDRANTISQLENARQKYLLLLQHKKKLAGMYMSET